MSTIRRLAGRRDLASLLCILALFFIVMVWLSARLNLYVDELYSLHTTGRGFGYALDQSQQFEQQPPFYFLALTLWRYINSGDAFARLFSILCCVATLIAVAAFSAKRTPSLPIWVPPLVLAVNPFFIWAALDIRVYALILLISALLILFFFDLIQDGTSITNWIKFTIVAIVGMYTQYFIAALLLGFAVVIIASRRQKMLGLFVLAMMLVAAFMLPLAAGTLSRQVQQAAVVQIAPPTVIAVRMLSSLVAFIAPHGWLHRSKVAAIIYGGLVVCGALALLLRRPRTTIVDCFALIALSGIAFFTGVIFVLKVPLEMPRHIASLFVPVMALMFAMLAAVRSAQPRSIIVIYVLVVMMSCECLTDIATYHSPFSKTGDWERVGTFLNDNVRHSDTIAVYDPEAELGVRHYYQGSADIVPLPRAQSFLVFDRRDFAIVNEQQLETALSPRAVKTPKLWFVFGVSGCTMIEVGRSCSILADYMARHYVLRGVHRFDGTMVEELFAK